MKLYFVASLVASCLGFTQFVDVTRNSEAISIRRTPMRTIAKSLTLCLLVIPPGLVEPGSADSEDTTPPEPLLRSQLAEQVAPGREVIVRVSTRPPHSTGEWHRHPAESFHYYLEGEITIEIEGMEPIKGTPGTVGHVPYMEKHRAVTGDKGAKVLIVRVVEEGKPEKYADSTGTSESQ
jgi:quercetin dioxygenase-like cupin family protein